METFRAEYGLDETNFALSYRNAVTGETYHYNETHFMLAGSTYKLPLNLYYYDLEAAGEISADTPITEDCSLAYVHEQSLLNSNNELSHALIYRIGSFWEYKQAMRRYFTMTDAEIDPSYYEDNYYCTRMMLDTLQVLWDRQEDYAQALSYLEQAMPEHYFRRDLPDVRIAHKYGLFEASMNDVGIIWAKQPFLLAVYTSLNDYLLAEDVIAQAAVLFYDYTNRQARSGAHADAGKRAAPVSAPADRQEAAAAMAQARERLTEKISPKPTQQELRALAAQAIPERQTAEAPWAFIGAAILLGTAAGACLAIRRGKRKCR